MPLHHETTTRHVIGAAIEVHRHLGPGLLERAYQRCLAHELGLRGVGVALEVPLNLEFKGLHVSNSYRIDLVVDNVVVVETKAIEHLTAIHEAQLMTYLRLSGLKTGLLLNFNTRLMKDGILRRVL